MLEQESLFVWLCLNKQHWLASIIVLLSLSENWKVLIMFFVFSTQVLFSCWFSVPSGSSHFKAFFSPRKIPASTSSLSIKEQIEAESRVEHVGLLNAVEDLYEGIVIEMKEPVDSTEFIPSLRASIVKWRQQVMLL